MNVLHSPLEGKDTVRSLLTIGLLLILITGCAITEDYQPPPVEVQPDWRVDLEAVDGLANTAWWQEFEDPVLNELIRIAINENKDLMIATARLEAAEARLMISKADYYPQITYGGSAGRRKESETRTYAFGRVLEPTHTVYEGYLGASWELDVWGRVRRSTEASRAELLSTVEGRQAVILMLVSSVANGYIELLAADKKLDVVRETIDFRREWLELFEKKRAGGQISELELVQVRTSYEEAVTEVARIELQIAKLENALSVLLGRNPGAIKHGKTLDTVMVPNVPQGIPSDILVRRPDIRQSEQNLIAANAKIGVARTLYFPSISLTGLFGYASSEIDDLFTSPSNVWEIGAGLLGYIFSGGRIKANVIEKESEYKQLLYAYLQTIQNAFREVDDSLVSIQKLRELNQTEKQLIGTLKDYNRYSQESYNSGFASYLTVMDAQERLFLEQMRYAEIQGRLLSAMVNVYKTMGGGWITEAADLMEGSNQEPEPKS